MSPLFRHSFILDLPNSLSARYYPPSSLTNLTTDFIRVLWDEDERHRAVYWRSEFCGFWKNAYINSIMKDTKETPTESILIKGELPWCYWGQKLWWALFGSKLLIDFFWRTPTRNLEVLGQMLSSSCFLIVLSFLYSSQRSPLNNKLKTLPVKSSAHQRELL